MNEALRIACDVISEGSKMPTIGAFVAVSLGYYFYKKQKELEDVRAVYLKDGLEKMLEQLSRAYNSIHLNYNTISVAIATLEVEKDTLITFANLESEKERIRNALAIYRIDFDFPSFRLIQLLGNDTIWHCYKAFMLDINQSMEFFTNIGPALFYKAKQERYGLGGGEKVDIAHLQELCKKYRDRAQYWNEFLFELEKLTVLIRSLNIDNFRNIENVSGNKHVIKILVKMKQILDDRKSMPDWGKVDS